MLNPDDRRAFGTGLLNERVDISDNFFGIQCIRDNITLHIDDHKGRFVTHCAVIPPSAETIEPVIKEDSSEAKNRTRFAISRLVPGRPIG